jgi:hypothetical protein
MLEAGECAGGKGLTFYGRDSEGVELPDSLNRTALDQTEPKGRRSDGKRGLRRFDGRSAPGGEKKYATKAGRPSKTVIEGRADHVPADGGRKSEG